MPVIAEASEKLSEFIENFPSLTLEAIDLFQLMCDEIDTGKSPDNEYKLFMNSLDILKEELLK